MKKIIFIFALVCMIVPLGLSAQMAQFSVSLGYGSTDTAEVLKLQQFLASEGFLTVTPTGNYLGLTQEAVKAFQHSQGIDETGYFGPLSRAAAQSKLAVHFTPAAPQSSITAVSLAPNNSLAASIFLSSSKKIQWKTAGYPANVGVNINLLRKVSDTPTAYTFVRQIAGDTQNDGEEVWTPTSNEKGSDMYIEVTCSTTHTFTEGCQTSLTPINVQ